VCDVPLLEDALLIVGFGAFAVVGALLVAKRSTNLIGWIMAAVALMVGLGLVDDAYSAYVMTTSGQPDPLAVVGAGDQGWFWYLLLSLVVVYLPLLFPDGCLLSRWWLRSEAKCEKIIDRGASVTLFVTFGRRLILRM
jgi:hypothetical protein